jgi:hypothetical protein
MDCLANAEYQVFRDLVRRQWIKDHPWIDEFAGKLYFPAPEESYPAPPREEQRRILETLWPECLNQMALNFFFEQWFAQELRGMKPQPTISLEEAEALREQVFSVDRWKIKLDL